MQCCAHPLKNVPLEIWLRSEVLASQLVQAVLRQSPVIRGIQNDRSLACVLLRNGLAKILVLTLPGLFSLLIAHLGFTTIRRGDGVHLLRCLFAQILGRACLALVGVDAVLEVYWLAIFQSRLLDDVQGLVEQVIDISSLYPLSGSWVRFDPGTVLRLVGSLRSLLCPLSQRLWNRFGDYVDLHSFELLLLGVARILDNLLKLLDLILQVLLSFLLIFLKHLAIELVAGLHYAGKVTLQRDLLEILPVNSLVYIELQEEVQ